MTLDVGTSIGRYEIRSLLGTGGMGEVYRAYDAQLGREVALKLLPVDVASDPRRMSRFVQEARAASALNHPHIMTVYDIGQTDRGLHFIAAELIAGETLRARLSRGPLKLAEALEIATQVASALVAAHGEGIVHRDIKPENIMLRPDGYSKLLDFGLAKLTSAISSDETTATRRLLHTDPGAVVGTVAYMSPEQAQGSEVDARTDIWSVGVLLFEMITGRRPFQGASPSHTMVAILDHEPPPLMQYLPDAPEFVQEIISDALAKDPDARLQTAKQLLAKLRRCKQRLDGGSGSARAAQPAADDLRYARINHASDRRSDATTGFAAVSQSGAAQRSHQVTGKRTRSARRLAVVCASVLIGIAVVWYYTSARDNGPSNSGAPLTAVPLTSDPGVERNPALSPDGRQIAYISDRAGQFDVYVQLVGAGEPLRLTSTSSADEMSPVWSPDGSHIAFLRGQGEGVGFYIIPALGGREQKIADAYGWRFRGAMAEAIDWSPDGKTLAVVDKSAEDEPWSLFLLSPDSGEKRRLTQPPAGSNGDMLVAFSPDGSRIAFARTQQATGSIYVLPVGGGEPARITSQPMTISGIAWTSDGASLVLAGGAPGSNPTLWRVDATAGSTPSPARVPAEYVLDVTSSRRSNRLAYAPFSIDTNIYSIDREHDPGTFKWSAPKIWLRSTQIEQFARFSRDGSRVAFVSRRSGAEELWVCDADGKNTAQLTRFGGQLTLAGAGTSGPSWSPDDRRLAFSVRETGNADIYIVDANGVSPRRMTTDASAEQTPSWSRDGRWLYFASDRTGRNEVWRMPASGGQAAQITRHGGSNPIESPNDDDIFYLRSGNESGIWRVTRDGGEDTRVIEAPVFAGSWVLVPSGIYFLAPQRAGATTRAYEFEFFDFQTGRRTSIIRLARDWQHFIASDVTISPDGRRLLYTQRDRLEADIMLLENFR